MNNVKDIWNAHLIQLLSNINAAYGIPNVTPLDIERLNMSKICPVVFHHCVPCDKDIFALCTARFPKLGLCVNVNKIQCDFANQIKPLFN